MAGAPHSTRELSLTGQVLAGGGGRAGEVSLTGRVLGIGGVKEKVLAAQRSGLKTLVFPEANRSEFEELDDKTKQGLDVHFVQSYGQVRRIRAMQHVFVW